MAGLYLVTSQILRNGERDLGQKITHIVGPLESNGRVTVGLGQARIDCEVTSVHSEDNLLAAAVAILAVNFDEDKTVVVIPGSPEQLDDIIYPVDAPDVVGKTVSIAPGQSIELIRGDAVTLLCVMMGARKIGDVVGLGGKYVKLTGEWRFGK